MKKLSPKLKKHYISLQRKKSKKYRGRWRNKNLRHKTIIDVKHSFLLKDRRTLKKALYKKKRYHGSPFTIRITQPLGIEEERSIDYFFEISSQIIDFNARELIVDIRECERIWPSGITLLCSLKQWVETKSKKNSHPKIRSTPSNHKAVNSYLAHSGFYDYVQRMEDDPKHYFDDSQIVKIHRELKRSNIEKREEEIVELLRKFSLFTEEEIEEFNCVILTEIFNNVTEHGVPVDSGWWVLAQYHKTHKIISFCTADNGIGIRNSLMTGPQKKEIGKKIPNNQKEEGNFIKISLEENISGAVEASQKKGHLIKKYSRGARRGNGLERIRGVCRKLSIPFTILSHYGYLFIDGQGNVTKCGARNTRIFAGTMYHLIIKAQ